MESERRTRGREKKNERERETETKTERERERGRERETERGREIESKCRTILYTKQFLKQVSKRGKETFLSLGTAKTLDE